MAPRTGKEYDMTIDEIQARFDAIADGSEIDMAGQFTMYGQVPPFIDPELYGPAPWAIVIWENEEGIDPITAAAFRRWLEGGMATTPKIWGRDDETIN
jgi:hypothetical protein